jgi:hypothetical protein
VRGKAVDTFGWSDAMKQKMTRGLLAAVFAGAMGFGAAQAFAAPVTQAVAGCTPESCQKRCAQDGLYGFCTGRGCWCQ